MTEDERIERAREGRDRLAGAPVPEPAEADEAGDFSVRVVYLDGVERVDSDYGSLREALEESERARKNLAAAGYGRSRVHVDVIDNNDPERGSLDWGALDDLSEDT